MAFELTAVRTDGPVVITARVDGDGVMDTRAPGDVEGAITTSMNNRNITLVLNKLVGEL